MQARQFFFLEEVKTLFCRLSRFDASDATRTPLMQGKQKLFSAVFKKGLLSSYGPGLTQDRVRVLNL